MKEKFINNTLNTLKSLHNDERGDYAVELACMFPIIMFIAMMLVDNNIRYQAKIDMSVAVSTALRTAVTDENYETAKNTIKTVLTERFKQDKIGWCSGGTCDYWSANSSNLKIELDEKGWCNGANISVTVVGHKASPLPVYKSFKSFVTGGDLYQTHTYGPIKARVESNTPCS